ncbi:MAG: PfkB family carbohydrate kinase [Candidatus Moranbacteria bacterium]|nr:PfkB family carbohydrate kinase [Candidatus Moranbacteria bacterium]
MISQERTMEILSEAEGKPVLALGDVMLDAYLTGKVSRFSQEAPVPVVPVDDEKFFPGGAGNAAACMAEIGLSPHLFSVVGGNGRIQYGQILTEECEKIGIIPHFVSDPERKTTLKMRIAAVNTTKQNVVRVDMEDTFPLNSAKEREAIGQINASLAEINPLVLSLHDYKKGFLTENIFSAVAGLSAEKQIPIFADLKQDTFVKFRRLIQAPDLFYLKPNRSESVETAKLLDGFDKDGSNDEEITEVARIIQKEVSVQIIITRGGKGAALFEVGKDPYFVRPEEVEDQFDVAGAGDTVEAFLIAAYLGGATMQEALEIAVAASQVAIRKFGTSVVSEQELLKWISK